MLNETTIEKLSERLVNRIKDVNSYTLQLIGEQINRIGSMTPTNANKLINVLKYGGDIEKIVLKLTEITELNVKDIYDIFEEIAKSDLNFAKQFYDYRGMNYIPYEQNIQLQQQVRTLANITANEYLNISNSTGFVTKDSLGNKVMTDLSRTYQKTIDEAVLSINQGKVGYQEAMENTIRQLGKSGIQKIDYATGYSRRLDSSVRMNIMDAMRDLHNNIQEQIGKEVGTDGVEISVHTNSAPDHAAIQGKQFSNEEFQKMQSELSFKDYQGKSYEPIKRHISDWNCYHYLFSVILGVNDPEYTTEQLDLINDNNQQGFDFDGSHYTMYEGQQLQRRIETEIRKAKDTQIIAKASGNFELVDDSQRKITQLTKKYKELSDASGLPTKMDRLKVENYKRTSIDLNSYYNSKLNGITVGETKITEVSNHFVNDRRISRKLNIEMVEDTLKNPLNIGTIKVDAKGRKSFQVLGKQATLSINPDTGVITSGWRTSRKKVERYKGD